jgi:hypothetical protein
MPSGLFFLWREKKYSVRPAEHTRVNPSHAGTNPRITSTWFRWNRVTPSETEWHESDTKWHQVTPSEAEVKPSDTKWNRVTPSETEWHRVTPSDVTPSPSDTKWHQVKPSDTKWIQVTPSAMRNRESNKNNSQCPPKLPYRNTSETHLKSKAHLAHFRLHSVRKHTRVCANQNQNKRHPLIP